ncbi:chemotaxis protein, partial [Thermoanaerobacterium sp. PSU-2]
VRQIAAATKEQRNQGQNIVEAVENITNQAAQVSQATKEQAKGVEEIVQGVNNAREQVSQIATAAKEINANIGEEMNNSNVINKQAEQIEELIKKQISEFKQVAAFVKEFSSLLSLNGKDVEKSIDTTEELLRNVEQIKNILKEFEI